MPAILLPTAPANPPRWRRLLAPVAVSFILLIFTAAADAQSGSVTLCCDSGTGTCIVANGSAVNATSKTASTPCPDPVDSPSPSTSSTSLPRVMITVPNVSATACSGGPCPVQVEVTTHAYEPPNGFVGVCLAPTATYRPALPNVCYSVTIPGEANHAYAVLSARAASVRAPYSTLDSSPATAMPDSFQTLLTCYPHNAKGHCPCPSRQISQSCCDLGSRMTSLHNDVARGYATLPQVSAPQAPCNCLIPDTNDALCP